MACTLTPAITADPLTIGYANAGAAPFHSPFDGLIDEVKVYNTVHTSGEIAAQYNKEANGPVSLWPAEGNADDLIYGNDGTLENGATATAPGVFGTAFSFDGFDDHVVVPDSLNLNSANGITVEAWVYLTGKQGQNREIISKDGELTDRQFILTASNLDRFRAHVGVTGGLQFFDGQVPVQLNRWYHVAMTYDGASLKLYVNGELDGSIPVTGPIVSTTEPVRIGGGAPSGRAPLHFPGLIDEAVIFNRALSACEVAVNALVPCDTTPPEITPTVTGDLGNNGWYRSNVTVSWSVTDPESPVTSTSGCGTTILTGDTPGTTLTCTATSAGGTNSDSVTVNIDLTDPLISSSRSVAPNANGWNKTGVTVSYIASDALSGIDLGASDTGDDVLSTEGAGQSGTGTVVDEAGNSASATESPINIDLTDPLISPSRSVAPNANGWNKTGVTVSYIASDALSGIDLGASDTGDDVLSTEGAGQSGTGTVVDEAGNSASATESPINIDLTDPLISPSRSVAPNANGWNKTGVTVSYIASDDALSGIDLGASDTDPLIRGRRALHGGSGGPERYRDSGSRRGSPSRKLGLGHRESHQHRSDRPANQLVAKRSAQRQRVE